MWGSRLIRLFHDTPYIRRGNSIGVGCLSEHWRIIITAQDEGVNSPVNTRISSRAHHGSTGEDVAIAHGRVVPADDAVDISK